MELEISPKMRVALRNGRIVDVMRGVYETPGTQVILSGRKIETVAGPGEAVHADAVIDLQGRAVIPGLFNTHCHIQLKYPTMFIAPSDFGTIKKFGPSQIEKSMADCLTHGVTNVRDALSGDLRPNHTLRERINQGEILGPRLHQCVHLNPVGGTYTRKHSLFDYLISFISGAEMLSSSNPASGVMSFPVNASDQQVRDAINQAVDGHGAEYIKLYDQREFSPSYTPGALIMTDAQMQSAVDQAHRRGRKVTLHHLTVESFRRGVRAGVDSFAHLPFDAPLSPTDVEAFMRAGCILEPTATLLYYLVWGLPGTPWQNHPRMAKLNELRAQTSAEMVRAFWLPAFQQAALGHFSKAEKGQFKIMGIIDMSAPFRYWGGLIDRGVENLRKLYDAGATIACGTDAGAACSSEAMVNLELRMLDFCLNDNAAGRTGCFTPADALRAATLHSARAMGLETTFGSIEPGTTADLVILDGDPLSDLSRIGTQAAAVFLAGDLKYNACGLRAEPA